MGALGQPNIANGATWEGVKIYRIPKDQTAKKNGSSQDDNGEQQAAKQLDAKTQSESVITTIDGDANSSDFYWILASDKPHESTQEFYPFNVTRSPMSGGPTPRRSQMTMPAPQPQPPPQPRVPVMPPMPMMWPPMDFRRPVSVGASPHMMGMAPWLLELLSFKRKGKFERGMATAAFIQNNACNVEQLRHSEDVLAVLLLRLSASIYEMGEINSKLMLSRQTSQNEMKDLLNAASSLAPEVFEMLPPFFVGVSPKDIKAAEMVLNHSSMNDEANRSAAARRPSHTLPYSAVSLYPYPPAMPGMSAPMSAPPAADMGDCDAEMYMPPPETAMMPPAPEFAMPPHPGPMFFGHPSFGLPFVGRPDGARRSLDGLDLYSTAGSKKLSVGDRPLTPPAQGWYAKYSSGVTGVVWDRVHQAWVVSWTLAGKRTFRHFTCKSYGGFEKAREAAIEFRLARNRDIAAYNRRYKERN